MLTSRNLVIAGIALTAVGTIGIVSGSMHVFWVFFGLAWVFGGRGCAGHRHHHHHHRHHQRSRWDQWDRQPTVDPSRDRAAESAPDPTQDHHVAYPQTR